MATPKSRDSELDTNTNGGPVDPSVANYIRAEVQAALKGVQETFSAPPSYDSSAPLLSSMPTEDDVDTEAQQPAIATSSSPPSKPMTFMDWVRFGLCLSPYLTLFMLWAFLVGMGVDPLGFSPLALFLLFAEFVYTIFVFLVHERIQKGKQTPTANVTGESNVNDWKGPLAIGCGILGLYLVVCGVIWGWSILTPTSPYSLYRYSRDFQAKFDAPGALSTLAGCLQDSLPDRNATIADVSACLKSMGMNDSFVG